MWMILGALISCKPESAPVGQRADTVAPGDPQLMLVQPSSTSTFVAWSPAEDDQTDTEKLVYEVYLDGSDTPAATVVGDTWVTLEGLSRDEEHTLAVRACDAAGNISPGDAEAAVFTTSGENNVTFRDGARPHDLIGRDVTWVSINTMKLPAKDSSISVGTYVVAANMDGWPSLWQVDGISGHQLTVAESEWADIVEEATFSVWSRPILLSESLGVWKGGEDGWEIREVILGGGRIAIRERRQVRSDAGQVGRGDKTPPIHLEAEGAIRMKGSVSLGTDVTVDGDWSLLGGLKWASATARGETRFEMGTDLQASAAVSADSGKVELWDLSMSFVPPGTLLYTTLETELTGQVQATLSGEIDAGVDWTAAAGVEGNVHYEDGDWNTSIEPYLEETFTPHLSITAEAGAAAKVAVRQSVTVFKAVGGALVGDVTVSGAIAAEASLEQDCGFGPELTQFDVDIDPNSHAEFLLFGEALGYFTLYDEDPVRIFDLPNYTIIGPTDIVVTETEQYQLGIVDGIFNPLDTDSIVWESNELELVGSGETISGTGRKEGEAVLRVYAQDEVLGQISRRCRQLDLIVNGSENKKNNSKDIYVEILGEIDIENGHAEMFYGGDWFYYENPMVDHDSFIDISSQHVDSIVRTGVSQSLLEHSYTSLQVINTGPFSSIEHVINDMPEICNISTIGEITYFNHGTVDKNGFTLEQELEFFCSGSYQWVNNYDYISTYSLYIEGHLSGADTLTGLTISTSITSELYYDSQFGCDDGSYPIKADQLSSHFLLNLDKLSGNNFTYQGINEQILTVKNPTDISEFSWNYEVDSSIDCPDEEFVSNFKSLADHASIEHLSFKLISN